MLEGWRCSSEVERLSNKIGKRDPEFTPQNKQRKDRVGGGIMSGGSAGWGCRPLAVCNYTISMHECDPQRHNKKERPVT